MKDLQSQKERHFAEVNDLQKSIDMLHHQMKDASHKMQSLQTSLHDKERSSEALTLKNERLNQGLAAHKQQILLCDERIAHMGNVEQQLKNDLRDLTLHCEQLKMENVRLGRDRDRAYNELSASQTLQRRM